MHKPWLSARSRAGQAGVPGPAARALSMLLSLIFSAGCWQSPALAESRSGYEVKAAFVLNFLKFAESKHLSDPVHLCLYGGEEAQDAFSRLDSLRVPAGQIVYRAIELNEPVSDCEVLFLASDKSWKARLESAEPVPLTIGEDDLFIAAGGLISFFTEDDKIRFAINLEAARARGVVFSSQLLRLAKIENK